MYTIKHRKVYLSISPVLTEKNTQLKKRPLFPGNFRTSGLETAFPQRTLSKEVKEESGYIKVCSRDGLEQSLC